MQCRRSISTTRLKNYGLMTSHFTILSINRRNLSSFHPRSLLFNGITIGSALSSFVSVRRFENTRGKSSMAGEFTSNKNLEDEEETITTSIPEYIPHASPIQLRALSRLLRSQLSSNKKAFDALFTLRQLHMLKPPRLNRPNSTLEEEKWLWRLPATVAIHAILRLASTPITPISSTSNNTDNIPELISIATTLASNALGHDTLNRSIVLDSSSITKSKDKGSNVRLFGGRKDDVVIVDTNLEELEIELNSKDPARVVEKKLLNKREALWSDAIMKHLVRRNETYDKYKAQPNPSLPVPLRPLPLPTSSSSTQSQSTQLASIPLPSPFQLASLSPRTLELLFLFLTKSPTLTPELKIILRSFSLTLKSLKVPLSTKFLAYEFNEYIKEQRVDLAVKVWGNWVENQQSLEKQSRTSKNKVTAGFRLIQKALEVNHVPFGTEPRKKILAASSDLIKILNSQWKKALKESTKNGSENSPFSVLLAYLAKFPLAPFVEDASVEDKSWQRNLLHSKVYNMNLTVFRNIMQDIIGKPLYLRSLGIKIGTTPSLSKRDEAIKKESQRTLPLSLIDYNVLIFFSLKHFNSPELAFLILQKMTDAGYQLDASTRNSLLSTVSSSGDDALVSIRRNTQNEQTLPTFITYLTSISDFNTLNKLVYAILPELDTQPFYSPIDFHLPLSSLPPATPPPLDRNPYLYITILNALVKAGKTGLAERVFRLARWAAELSRSSTDEGVRPWILPPHAFTIMLQLYASEVVRGIRLEKQRQELIDKGLHVPSIEDIGTTPYVKGWGRHALRVFILKTEQEVLKEQLGPDSEVRQQHRNENTDKPIPPILRREAAAIVAEYELEGGSKELEMKSLKSAMKHEFSKSAMIILFPQIEERLRLKRLNRQNMKEEISLQREDRKMIAQREKAEWSRKYPQKSSVAERKAKRDSKAKLRLKQKLGLFEVKKVVEGRSEVDIEETKEESLDIVK